MADAILLERRHTTAILTLNRPQVHNAFDDGLIAETTAALEFLAGDAGIRALVLTGAGATFSAGADLNWMRRMAQAGTEENRDDALRLAKLLRLLQFFPKPTLVRNSCACCSSSRNRRWRASMVRLTAAAWG